LRADVDAWAAGGAARDSVTLRVMAFAESRGQAPLVTTVTVGRGWREVALPFAAFGGMDGKDVMAFIFSAGPAPGAFRFALDDVRLR
jgi:hypothetical protein